jgi:hypothetical protein
MEANDFPLLSINTNDGYLYGHAPTVLSDMGFPS